MKKLLYITLILLGLTSTAYAITTGGITGPQGGTGITGVDAGDVGKVLTVFGNAPFTYTLSTVSSGGGTSFPTSTNPLMATFFVATSTTQPSFFAGNIGIGTTTIFNPQAWGRLFQVSNPSAVNGAGISLADQNTEWNMATYNSAIRWSNGIASPSMILTNTNRLGIGTTTPYAPLSVVGFGGIVASSINATSTTELSKIAGNFQVNSGTFYVDATNNRIGFGTTTPGTILSIGNTGSNTINISETATSTFGTGINLKSGCYAVNGACIIGGGGGTAGPVTTTLEFMDNEPQTDSNGFSPGGSYWQPIYGWTFTNGTSSRVYFKTVIPNNVSATPNASIIPWLSATGTPSTGIALVDFAATTTNSNQSWYTTNFTSIHAASTTPGKRFTLATGTSLPITSTTTISLSGLTLNAGDVLIIEATRYGADANDTVDNDIFMPKLFLKIDVN